VNVADNYFSPADISVIKGDSVTWTFTTGTTHNVTFTDGGGSSGDTAGPSVKWGRVFNSTGTFNYSCTIHHMTGSVLVTLN